MPARGGGHVPVFRYFHKVFKAGFMLRNKEGRRPLDIMFSAHHAKLLRADRPSCVDEAFLLLAEDGLSEEQQVSSSLGLNATRAISSNGDPSPGLLAAVDDASGECGEPPRSRAEPRRRSCIWYRDF